MIAVARYLLAEATRSRSVVAPATALLIGLFFLYSAPPNPVLPTAGSVAAFLFFVQAWLALMFFNSQPAAERHMLAATAGARRFALGRLLAGGALAAGSAGLAVVYPVATARFGHMPGPGELSLCLLAGFLATAAGTALAALFARPFVRSRAVAVLGVTAAALLTVPHGPPAVAVAAALNTEHAADVPARLAGDLAATAVFVVAAVVACLALWRRYE